MVATAMPFLGTSAGGQSTLEGPGSSRPWHGSNGLARPSQPSFQASWRDAPISRKAGCKDPRTLQDLEHCHNGCPACPSDSTDFKSRLLISTPWVPVSDDGVLIHPGNSLPSSILLTFCPVSSLVDFLPQHITLVHSFYLSPVPAPWIEPPHPQPRQWLRPPPGHLTLSPSSSWWGQLSVGGFPLSSLQSLLPTWPPRLAGFSLGAAYQGHCPCSQCSRHWPSFNFWNVPHSSAPPILPPPLLSAWTFSSSFFPPLIPAYP